MKKKGVWLVTGFLALFFVLGTFIYVTVANAEKVVEVVQIEAGASIDVSQFLLDKEDQGNFATDLSTIDLTQPGTYTVEIQVGKKNVPLNFTDRRHNPAYSRSCSTGSMA